MADRSDKSIHKGPYPELTLASVGVGYAIGIVVTIAFSYASLVLGFSKNASELAAILGFGILRGIMRRTSIVENNINQTIASAINAASTGLMFSIPALFILDYTDFNPILMTLACISGGVLGIALVIPLRKQMIDYSRLAFPGGIAVATILKTPGAGVRKAMLLLGGALLSGVVHLFVKKFGFIHWPLGAALGIPSYFNFSFYLSLMTVALGFLAGRGGLFLLTGGYVCYFFLAPVLAGFNLLPSPEALADLKMTMPNYLGNLLFKPVGIGMLVGGAITGMALTTPLIKGAIVSMQRSAKQGSDISRDEMSIKLLYAAIAAAFVVLFVVAVLSAREVGTMRGLAMALLGALWIWIAGVIMSECHGRTAWSPLSGMALIAVTILIIASSGLGDAASAISSVLVGASVCVALSLAVDMMQDLKTGFLVGSTPAKQQLAQLTAVWLGPILGMAIIYVLHRAYGMGSEQLPAPQGQALAGIISSIQGGNVPIAKYAAGGCMGALLSAGGYAALGIVTGLGFYLPFSIVLTFSLGCFLRIVVDWTKRGNFSHDVGTPVATGFIVGEALVGVGFALSVVLTSFTS